MAAPTKKTERFQTTQILGEDLLGRLELASDAQNGATVLLRRYSARFFPDPAATQQFLQRVKALAAQKREGFQRVLAIGSTQGEPWLACQASRYATLAQLPRDTKLDAVGRLFGPVAARLDQLHAEGRVHGDLRPETLVFDNAGALLIGETAGHHALFGWGDGPVRLPAGAIGAMVSPDRVAPEVARTGVIDARADQYALALCLADCLNAGADHGDGGTARSPLHDVLRFALSPNPADRYRSCAEMVQAVQGALARSRPPAWRKAALALVPIAALVVMYLLGTVVGRAMEEGRAAAAVEQLKSEIVAQYNVALPAVENSPLVDTLRGADALATNLVDKLIQDEESVQDAALRKQYDRLTAVSRLRLESEFARPATFDPPGGTSPIAVLIPADGPVKFGAAESPLDWQLLVQIPDVGPAVVPYQLVVRALDSQRKPIGEPREIPFDISKNESTFRGSVEPPAGGWPPGSTVSLEATLVAGKRDEVWQDFGVWHVAQFEWTKAEIELSPAMVKEKQSEGYAVPAGIDVAPGDLVQVSATGSIKPATQKLYDTMGIPGNANGPDGVKVTSSNVDDYWVVDSRYNWAALLFRFGEEDKWRGVTSQFLIPDAGSAGDVFLSINSATHMKKVQIKQSDDRFWQPNGAFRVNVLRGRLNLPAEAPSAQASRARVLARISRNVGNAPSAAEKPVDLTGTWESNDGMTVQITDDSEGRVRIQQTQGETYRKFEFTFERDGSGFLDRGGKIALAEDKSDRTHDVDGRLSLAGPNRLTLETDSFRFDEGELVRRQRGGHQIILTKNVPREVAGPQPTQPKKLTPKNVNFTGNWSPSDYRGQIFVRDEGTLLTASVIASEEFGRLNAVIKKADEGFTVESWTVTYRNDPFQRTFTLKGRIEMVDENTLKITTDQIRFNRRNAAVQGTDDLAYTTFWNRVTAATNVPGVFGQPGSSGQISRGVQGPNGERLTITPNGAIPENPTISNPNAGGANQNTGGRSGRRKGAATANPN